MPTGDPLAPGEKLLRRVPFYYLSKEPSQAPADPSSFNIQAFLPRKQDTTGISLLRRKHHEPGDLSSNPGESYIAAEACVDDIRSVSFGSEKLDVVERPSNRLRGHAEIPQITYQAYMQEATKRLVVQVATDLAYLFREVWRSEQDQEGMQGQPGSGGFPVPPGSATMH